MGSAWVLVGDNDPQIVVGGESHRRALLYAIEEYPRDDLRRAVMVSEAAETDDAAAEWAEYWPLFVKQARGRVAALLWSGNQHVSYFLFETGMEMSLGGPFPYRPSGSTGTFVTEGALRALLAPTVEPLGPVVAALSTAANSVLVLGTPPPSSGEVTRERFLAASAKNRKMQSRGIDIATIALQPDEQRVALWWLVQEMTREIAEANGARWVPVPPRAYDDHGLLLPEYARDGTHGNGAFGAVMWDEIAAVVGGADHE